MPNMTQQISLTSERQTQQPVWERRDYPQTCPPNIESFVVEARAGFMPSVVCSVCTPIEGDAMAAAHNKGNSDDN